jgi:hypothetical protein
MEASENVDADARKAHSPPSVYLKLPHTVVVISSGAAKKAAGAHFTQGSRQILGRRNKRSSPAKITEKILIA